MSSPFTNPAGRAPDQAQAYVKSILELLGDGDPLEVQSRTANELRSLVSGLSPERLDRPEKPGKWSIGQVVRHLADSELVCAWRLRLVIAQDRPAITGYDQDAWAARLGGSYPDAAAAIAVFETVRRANLGLLRSLSPADWERVGMHVERGAESVRLMARLYAGHDLVHLRQIRRILEADG